VPPEKISQGSILEGHFAASLDGGAEIQRVLLATPLYFVPRFAPKGGSSSKEGSSDFQGDKRRPKTRGRSNRASFRVY